jgi:hypothetical protein
MPPRDALISTGLIIGIILVLAGLIVAAAHHVLHQVIAAIFLLAFFAFCILI